MTASLKQVSSMVGLDFYTTKRPPVSLPPDLFCIFLINCKSGGRDGKKILDTVAKAEFSKNCIGYDLSVAGKFEDTFLKEVKEVIRKHSDKRIKFVVGGGDGSIRWTLTVIDRIYADENAAHPKLPLAILPLGVGNELSRCTGWSAAFRLKPLQSKSERLEKYIKNVGKGEDISMDRWSVCMSKGSNGIGAELILESDEPNDTTTSDYHDLMLCFLSIGFDSNISNKFQDFRKSNPKYTFSRSVNKMWYTMYGIQEMYKTFPYVGSFLELKVDGKIIPLPPTIRTLQVFNITTGAKDLLKEFKKPCASDGLLEVMGTEGVMHLVKTRLEKSHSRRIAQGHEIVIRVLNRDEVPIQLNDSKNDLEVFPLQIDGEAWTVQRGSTVTISFKDKFRVVRGYHSCKGMTAEELKEAKALDETLCCSDTCQNPRRLSTIANNGSLRNSTGSLQLDFPSNSIQRSSSIELGSADAIRRSTGHLNIEELKGSSSVQVSRISSLRSSEGSKSAEQLRSSTGGIKMSDEYEKHNELPHPIVHV